MRVFFVGHDLSYLLFYEAVQKNILDNKEDKFIHLYFRPSAYLYAKFVLKKNVIFLPFFGDGNFKHKIPKSKQPKVNLNFYGKKLSLHERNSLLSKFNFYEKELTRKIKDESIDIAIIPGEYRIFEQAIITSLKSIKKKCKLLYFESGPPGFIYIDKKGVNANASFKNSKVNSLVIHQASNQKIANKITVSTSRSFFFIFSKILLNIVDLVWLYLPLPSRNTSDFIEYKIALLARVSLFARKVKNLFQLHTSDANTKKHPYIFTFLGQVENDVNHTHFGVNQAKILKFIDEVMQKSNALLLWRNHPLSSNYDLFLNVKNRFPNRVVLDNSGSLKDILSKINGIITVNSNGGIEALLYGLPVLLLGKSYYQNLRGVEKVVNNFIILATKNTNKISKALIREDAKMFVRNSFFEVNYRGLDFKNAYLISNLLAYANKK